MRKKSPTITTHRNNKKEADLKLNPYIKRTVLECWIKTYVIKSMRNKSSRKIYQFLVIA